VLLLILLCILREHYRHHEAPQQPLDTHAPLFIHLEHSNDEQQEDEEQAQAQDQGALPLL
jgi:hypothetical protein